MIKFRNAGKSGRVYLALQLGLELAKEEWVKEWNESKYSLSNECEKPTSVGSSGMRCTDAGVCFYTEHKRELS